MKQTQTHSKGTFPWLFFGLTYGISWLIWGLVAISGIQANPLLILAGAFAPTIVGIVLTQFDPDKEQRRDFWKRVTDFKRIGIGWYGVIVLLFPAILAVAFVLNNLFGGPSVALDAAMQTLSNPLQLVGLIIMMFFGGPFAEELGWRGYALDRLQARWSALVSSLILGVIWGFWHLPLFFMKGTSQAAMGFGPAFWLFILDAVLLSILFSWVYNNTQRSTLSALLLHWAYNFSMTLIMQMGGTMPLQAAFLKTGVTLVVTIIVVAVWGSQTMTRTSSKVESAPTLS